MTVSLKHSFTSAKADGTDSTLIQPSNWNEDHVLTLAAGKVLGRHSSSAGAVQELPISIDPTLQSMIPPKGTEAQRPTGIAGMMRYNTTSQRFEGYSSAWGTLGGGCAISDTAPTGPVTGDLWWKSDEGQMYVYYTDISGSQWVIANAFAGGSAYLPLTGGTITGALSVTGNLAVTGDLAATGNITIASGSSLSGRVLTRGTVVVSPTTLSWNSDNYDQYTVSTLASALTIDADSGTPLNGQRMIFRIKDNGTARTLNWTTGVAGGFRVVGTVLPTTTTINKVIYVGCIYNSSDSRWDVIAVTIQA